MGGAEDIPQRSSSPLKRRASNLDAEESSQKDDVDMITVSDQTEAAEASTRSTRAKRGQSVDMLRGEADASTPTPSTQTQEASSSSVETGTLTHISKHSY
jgi:ubiquitin carboxyl-terminal hydrolase 4/11